MPFGPIEILCIKLDLPEFPWYPLDVVVAM
jgi:hypothetical protein